MLQHVVFCCLCCLCCRSTFFSAIYLAVIHFIRTFANDYEKSRNEKSRNMENPFKFGTIVEEEYFTDRIEEVAYIRHFIESANHLILISPRRFGKSSVVAKALSQSSRKSITVNLQQVTSVADLSAKLLREFFKIHPLERIRHLISHFRIIPTLTANPLTGLMDVSFQPGVDASILLEDVMDLIENAHTQQDRIVIVLDEFQEILDLAPGHHAEAGAHQLHLVREPGKHDGGHLRKEKVTILSFWRADAAWQIATRRFPPLSVGTSESTFPRQL